MSWGHPGYFTLGVWNMWLKSDRRNYNPKIIKDRGYPWCRVVYYTHHCNHNLPGTTPARKPWDVLSPADYAWTQRTIPSKHWIKITCMHVCLGSDFWSYVQNHASLQEIDKKKKIIKTKILWVFLNYCTVCNIYNSYSFAYFSLGVSLPVFVLTGI